MENFFEDGQTFKSAEEMVLVLSEVVKTQAGFIDMIVVNLSAEGKESPQSKATDKMVKLCDALHEKMVQDITILSMEKALEE